MTINNKLLDTLSYVDLSYKGYLFTESSTIYETKQLDIQSLIESVLVYPMGDINKIYPTGSLIPLIDYSSKKIRIKIKWKVSIGKLSFSFFTRSLTRIANSGIYTLSSENYAEFNGVIDIPNDAYYLVLVNENNGIASIEYITLYSVATEKPGGLSKILLKDVEALKNTFKMWLFSKRGDYGRKLNKGGPVDWLLGKQISQITTDEIFDRLKTEIETQFYNITAQDILIEPIPEQQKYKITLFISDDYNKYVLQIPFIVE